MAATPPGARKRKLDFMIDQNIFDSFMKMVSNKGFAPQVELELLMKKYINSEQNASSNPNSNKFNFKK